jgi:magnesium transporter
MLMLSCCRQLEWADTEIKEIQHAIRNTEDTVEIQLDLLRNRIMRFELFLNMLSSVLALGAVVTGVFGMNLQSGYEIHPTYFVRVTALLTVVMLAFLGVGIMYGVRGKLL